jgi:transposase
MDNVRIRHGEGILELAELYEKFVEIHSMIRANFSYVGVRIEFPPPYSPDLNPIKEVFSKVKAFLHRHRALLVREGDGMLFDLLEITEVVTASDAVGYFLHAGYF